ncbi:MAG: GIY-YIG nuclease family protein [Phycisphaerae bacterium]|nr:GIY-YIG nuclease family protein [Phycisphaerae bacterium]
MPRLPAQVFKQKALGKLPDETGVYALCDLDETPMYVGQSTDGIRARVRRHLTSARSDVIANRQIDVWEIAFVWAWPVQDTCKIGPLEAHLFHQFNGQSPLVNGTIPSEPQPLDFHIPERVRVQVMDDKEIDARRDPTLRFPRQIQHFGILVDYILNTQDKPHLRRALNVYLERLRRYFAEFVGD